MVKKSGKNRNFHMVSIDTASASELRHKWFFELFEVLYDFCMKRTCEFEESSCSVWLALRDNGSVHLSFFHRLFKTLSTPDAVSKSALNK